MRGLRVSLLVLVVVLLSACATREPRPAGAWLQERQSWFEERDAWTIDGRVGLSDGERGGSLAFTWQAAGEEHHIHLRTTTGGRQWRLNFSPGYALLEGSDVDRLVASHPDPIVEEAVGWPIPMQALAWWIRGLLPPGGGRARFAEDGTLEGISDPVWQLSYQRFSDVEGQLLPTRLQAESDPYRVRIVIRDWRFGVEAR
jgi:outer membrane lipoprotein LolB